MADGSTGPNYVLDKTFKLATGETITGYQVVYQHTTAGECKVATGPGTPYLGVAQLDPNDGVTLTAGDSVRVRMMGISKVQAAAAVAINGKVAVTGLGLVDDPAPYGAGSYYLGIALSAATQLYDEIEVDLSNKNSQYFTS